MLIYINSIIFFHRIKNHSKGTTSENTEQNDNPTENQNTKPTATKNNTQNHKESPKQRKNRKMTEQIIPQEQIDKSENRKTTRLRNQLRKNYKIFIPPI